MDKKTELFERMPVSKALATLAIPTIISQLITMIYNLADTYFIGLTGDPVKVAASTLAFTIFFMLCGLSNLFGVGGGSHISRLLGAKKEDEVKCVSSFSFYSTLALTALFGLFCYLFMDSILPFLGASDATFGYAAEYTLWVVIVGGIPATGAMCLSHLLRSEGYASKASFGLGLGGVLNIILDPIFMFVLLPEGQEVRGAAIATMLSNVISLAYFLIVMARLRGKTALSLSPRYMGAGARHTGKILATGVPSAAGALLASVSNMVLNQLSAAHSDIQLAALGIVKKIDMLPLNVGMGLCQGMLPLAAYNYASGDHRRMKKAMLSCGLAGVAFALLCILLFQLAPDFIVHLFIDEAATVSYGAIYLRIACLATPLMILNLLATFSLQAMGKGPESLVLSISRQGFVNIPLQFLFNSLWGMTGLVFVQLAADFITLFLSLFLILRVFRRIKNEK